MGIFKWIHKADIVDTPAIYPYFRLSRWAWNRTTAPFATIGSPWELAYSIDGVGSNLAPLIAQPSDHSFQSCALEDKADWPAAPVSIGWPLL